MKRFQGDDSGNARHCPISHFAQATRGQAAKYIIFVGTGAQVGGFRFFYLKNTCRALA